MCYNSWNYDEVACSVKLTIIVGTNALNALVETLERCELHLFVGYNDVVVYSVHFKVRSTFQNFIFCHPYENYIKLFGRN
jgi:hypothetical protein